MTEPKASRCLNKQMGKSHSRGRSGQRPGGGRWCVVVLTFGGVILTILAGLSSRFLICCEWSGDGGEYSVAVSGATLWLDVIRENTPNGAGAGAASRWHWQVQRLPKPQVNWVVDVEDSPTYRSLGVPLWIPIAGIGAITTWCLRRWREAPAPGTCPCCGYDLTGNTSGRCSECGGPIPANRGSHGSTDP